MKNTIGVLIAVLFCIPVFAQQDSVKTSNLPGDNRIAYPKLTGFLSTEKKYSGFLHSKNNKQWTSKRFTDLFNQHKKGKAESTGRGTFMDGPIVYPFALPPETGRNANTLYQRYVAGYTPPSAATTALQILGLVGGIAAGVIDQRYNIGNRNTTAVDAYLQSTYYHHNN